MKMPHQCPSCKKQLTVSRMSCSSCGSVLEGKFTPCPVCQLDPSMQKLFDLFIRSRGNLKEVQRRMNLSYPTVRVKMEEMFARLLASETPQQSPLEILRLVRERKISVADAEDFLKGL